MDIAFLIYDITLVGGTERITISIANTFAKHGYNVSIISCVKRNSDISFPFLSPKVRIYYLQNSNLHGLKKKNRVMQYISFIMPLRQLLKRIKIPLLLCQSFPMSMLGRISSIGLPIKIVACEHTSYAYYSKWLRFLSTVFYQFVSSLVLINSSDYSNRWLIKKRVLIPNLTELQQTDHIPNFYNKCIVSIGRLEHHKGFDLLIKAMQIVIREFPNWTLTIYGDGTEYTSLSDEIKELRLEKNVRLKGTGYQLSDMLGDATIVVVPSRIEGFGLVILEACSYNIPVISYDCPSGPRDILSNSTGILVRNGDVNAMAEAIMSLISDETRWMELSRKTKEVLNRYSSEKIFLQWENLFNSLIL